MEVVQESAKKLKEKEKDCEIYWCMDSSIDYEYNHSLDNVSQSDYSSS
jgi:hypothetical protein